jgi:hypothetical protein
MEKDKEKQMREEFEEFMSCCDVAPARCCSTTCECVKQALHPKFWLVFKKLSIVQLFAGSVTLLFCPQFGIGPLGGGHGLMHTFMELGPIFCALACGGFFFGVSAIVASVFLTREERGVAVRTGLGQFGLLGVASMAALMLVSTSVGEFSPPTAETVFFWLTGGVLTAWLVTFLLGPKAMRRPV